MLFKPEWVSETFHKDDGSEPPIVLIPNEQEALFETVQGALPKAKILYWKDSTEFDLMHMIERRSRRIVYISQTDWTRAVDEDNIRAFLKLLKSRALQLASRFTLITRKSIRCPLYNAATHPSDGVYVGLLQTYAKETDVPCFNVILPDYKPNHIQNAVSLANKIKSGTPVVLKDSKAHWSKLVQCDSSEMNSSSDRPKVGFTRGKTYAIVGSNGGLGGLFARHLAKEYNAKLILLGRKEHNTDMCEELLKLGAESVVYKKMDLINSKEVKEVFSSCPEIHGVIHSALYLKDATIANLSEDDLIASLHPKLHGTINLIDVLRGRQLDFVLFFSSIQSYIANAGQGNYTAACVSKDALADLMTRILMLPSKVINWGYWGSVGIVAKDIYRKKMAKLGIGSIEPSEGIPIAEAFLKSEIDQITVVKAENLVLKSLAISTNKNQKKNIRQSQTMNEISLSNFGEIIPPFDRYSRPVSRNIQSSKALDDYACRRLHEILLPKSHMRKFDRLVKAISAIPRRRSLSKSEILNEFPELGGHIELLDRCLSAYPEILSGNKDPLEVMFPGGRFDLVESVYTNNPVADYYNSIVAQVVQNFARQRSSLINVLEVGAGTGSTSKFVLPLIAENCEQYVFTDISYSFLNKARRKFSDYDMISFKLLDITEEPQDTGEYDVVISTNAIHATPDLDKTTKNIRRLLKRDGIFVLNEITSLQNFATLTFGLTDGWWLSDDHHRIPNSPLVSGENWQALMLKSGFSDVAMHGNKDQQVIVSKAMASFCEHGEAGLTINDFKEDKEDILDYIKSNISSVMEIDKNEIEDDIPFVEYGIDSLISMDLLNPFKEKLGYLPATILFEYPSVTKLAKYFEDTFPDKFRDPIVNSNQITEFGKTFDGDGSGKDKSERDRIRDTVVSTISKVMLIPSDQIKFDIPFREMGIDSIITLEILIPLKDYFGYLPSTLLFEHSTVDQLVDYLLNHHNLNYPPVSSDSEDRNSLGPVHKFETTAQFKSDHIAIIGMAGRLPQADNLDEFWENLREGRNCSSDIPSERWPLDGFKNPDSPLGPGSYTMRGCFLNNVDDFDADFFGITPRDAKRMDPQERLFLQSTYHSIQDAGYSLNQLNGSDTGVFVGVMNGAYAWHLPNNPNEPQPTSLFWSIANRTSYFFDWKGPSVAIDTACSSSLTALHTACNAIKSGDCRQAIVGGVNLIVHPRQYELLCGMHMLSPTEVCKPFGNHADGFVDGEGVISIMIKRMDDAIADGDRVYGVIRGSAVNSGGRSNGYTAPDAKSQGALISQAMKRADISPGDISYIEAHGTGTELGDPIEVRGLNIAFSGAGLKPGSIAIGSVKSNIGHLESAAGLSGLLKVLLQMKHGFIAPSLNAEKENVHLKLETTPFKINKSLSPWSDQKRKIAAVSSFGAGGANAHVIVEACDEDKHIRPQKQIEDSQLIVLSHKTNDGLQHQIDDLRHFLENKRGVSLSRLASTLAHRRDHFKSRMAFVVSSINELRQILENDLSEIVAKSMQERPLATYCMSYIAGESVDFQDFMAIQPVMTLPFYHFSKTRFWVDSSEAEFSSMSRICSDHRVNGKEMAPAAWILAKFAESNNLNGLKDIVFCKPVFNIESMKVETRQSDCLTLIDPQGEVYASAWLNDFGSVTHESHSITSGNYRSFEHKEIYARFRKEGYDYGKSLRPIHWAKVGSNFVKVHLNIEYDHGFSLPVSLIEGGLQSAILLPDLQTSIDRERVLVPFKIDSIEINKVDIREAVYCTCTLDKHKTNGRSIVCNFKFTNSHGEVLIKINGLTSILAKIDHSEEKSRFSGNQIIVHDLRVTQGDYH